MGNTDITEHLSVGIITILAGGGIIAVVWSAAITWVIAMLLFLGLTYLLIWAMGEWGWIDSSWLDEFLGTMTKWATDFFVLDFFGDILEIPFDQLKFIIARANQSKNFNVNNDGFIFMFVFCTYPTLYIILQ